MEPERADHTWVSESEFWGEQRRGPAGDIQHAVLRHAVRAGLVQVREGIIFASLTRYRAPRAPLALEELRAAIHAAWRLSSSEYPETREWIGEMD